jgi:hypothetical protein
MANNIIGDSFDFYVKDQILTRQSVLGLALNDQDVVTYKHNNSAFIRLTSGVNVSENIVKSLGLTGDKYKGSGLAKQFKLFSARAQSNSQEIFTKGIGYNDFSSYGFMSGPEYGYVPPPGIISAEVKALNRGSLREANIEIQCHNLQQFQILEILYMRLKYSILLEWGHNMYYTNPKRGNKLNISKSPQLEQSRFDLSDEMLDGTRSQQSMLDLIVNTRENSYGNYDAFFGLVTNFSWTLRPDGGYNITVTARSMGDVIESLKINTAYPIKNDPIFPGLSNNSSNPNTALQTDYYKSSLNRVLSAIVYKLNPANYAHGIEEGNNGNYNPLHNYKLEEYTGLKAAFNRTPESEVTNNQDQRFLTYNEGLKLFFPNLKERALYGTDHYYIKLGTLLRIIESFLIYYDTSKGKESTRPPVFKIDYNYNTNYCLTFPRHASLNPKVCLIPIPESSSNAATGLAKITTTYTYLTKDNPGIRAVGRGELPSRLDIDFIDQAGLDYYNNQFGWREETPTSTQTSISSLPPSFDTYALNSSYVTQVENIWSTPQTDSSNRERGYTFIRSLRNPFTGAKTQVTPSFGVKYITAIDEIVVGTAKTISKTNTFTDEEGNVVQTETTDEEVYKASIVVEEYRDLGSNYGGGNSGTSDPVYKKIIKDNPFRAGGFKGRTMHMLVHMEYIASTLTKHFNVETGEIALYDFLDNLMKGIQNALGNVNNFEIVYDEENNIHRIIDNTSIPGIVNTSKGIIEFNANILQAPRETSPDGVTNGKIGGSFIKNVNFKTKLSNNFATMTTIGAQKNGNAVGANATMLSKWNEGLTDRIITNRENPNYDSAASDTSIQDTFVKNVIALQNLNDAINNHTVGDYEVDSIQGGINDLFQAELGKFTKLPPDNEAAIPGIGFIPFDLELTMLGLSGPRIYEAYTIDTTLLPNSYKDKIQFICTGVSHKIADGEWTTTLNSIAGPRPYEKSIFNPPAVKVLPDRVEANNNGNNSNRGDLFSWVKGPNASPDQNWSDTAYMVNILRSSTISDNLIAKPRIPLQIKSGYPRVENYNGNDVTVTKYETTDFTSAENEQMFKDILTKIGAPATAGNLLWMKAWRKAEGGDATYNPWNSTQVKGTANNYNKNGVQNYFNYNDGIDATVATLTNGRYPTILKALKVGLTDKNEALELAKLTQQYDMTGLVPAKWQ